MTPSKRSGRYMFIVLTAWILCYVTFSAQHLFGRDHDSLVLNKDQELARDSLDLNTNRRLTEESLVLNEDQRLARQQTFQTKFFQEMFHLKFDNIFTNGSADFKRNIKSVLESDILRESISKKELGSNKYRSTTDLNKHGNEPSGRSQWVTPELKPVPGHREKRRKGNVSLDAKTIRDGMLSSSIGNYSRVKNNSEALADVRGTNQRDIAHLETEKNASVINSVSNDVKPSKEKSPDTFATWKRTLQNNYYNFSDTIITHVDRDFHISNKNLCRTSSPDLIILVPSSPGNIEKRTAIRSTYGTFSSDRKFNAYGGSVSFIVRIVFIIGKSLDTKVTEKVYEENEKYEDIVLVDDIDEYDFLTKKVLHGFKWVNEFCSNVSFVMKVDDDVFINVAVLTQRLKMYQHQNSVVFGFMYDGPRAVARAGKWAVTHEQFPFNQFPYYMSGTSYTITVDLIPKILHAAQRLPFMPIEDAFITGIIAYKIYAAKMIHWKDNSEWNPYTPDPCKFLTGHLSMTNMTPKLMNDAMVVLTSNGRMHNGRKCPGIPRN